MSGIIFQNIFNVGKEKFDYSDPVKAPHFIHRGAVGGFTDYALTKQVITIGRSKKNQIVINDIDAYESTNKKTTVSKKHASIFRERER